MFKTTLRSALILGFVALACTALSLGIHLMTQSRINAQRQAQQEMLLNQVLPAGSYNNAILQSCLKPHFDFAPNIQEIFVAKKDEQVQAYAIKAVTMQGYSGKIVILIGITPDGEILGVRVLEHKETPGLGDKVETAKSNWIYAFSNKLFRLNDSAKWAVKKDGGEFDQFAGATITPRAVVNTVKATAIAVLEHIPPSALSRLQPCE
ncbi:electron transport complex subunit RsxG [Pasteurellaceae bacterium 20609_3]|uniref:electron transport complex subunit RsxG n=1 Tax=Spirabiliibacterium mucosae TaxID=28156 RepID=UPI001AAC75A6|nr:electron transport complex subunit RsxG [Spirabiliibacterium mucosae]MBE2897759.1 electron transport complex subunit RsxG [Spirabiliibacterium mucosae]